MTTTPATVRPDEPVSRIMRNTVAVVDEARTAREVATELAAEEIGAVLVESEHGLLGIVSERDITYLVGTDGDVDVVQARDLMSSGLVTASPADPVRDVVARMIESGVRHVPVLADGRAVGIVSARDVLEVLSELPAQGPDRPV